MKVGILINCLEQGGAQNMVLRLFDSFDAVGIDTTLISIDRNQEVPLSHDKERATYLQKKKLLF
jgi:hypothetical protein